MFTCHDGTDSYWLQPLPAPFQTVSVEAREFWAVNSDVPPTAETVFAADGKITP